MGNSSLRDGTYTPATTINLGSLLTPADIRDETRELVESVFALGLKEAERRGLGRFVDSSPSRPTSMLRVEADFLLEAEEFLINLGL